MQRLRRPHPQEWQLVLNRSVSPLAKRLASARGIDLRSVQGTGPVDVLSSSMLTTQPSLRFRCAFRCAFNCGGTSQQAGGECLLRE
ncbi:MAG: E3 binding domain-containing protein [Candidatus Azotimanducaceae bacterium WSBS_2022_MAG_OTU7]